MIPPSLELNAKEPVLTAERKYEITNPQVDTPKATFNDMRQDIPNGIISQGDHDVSNEDQRSTTNMKKEFFVLK